MNHRVIDVVRVLKALLAMGLHVMILMNVSSRDRVIQILSATILLPVIDAGRALKDTLEDKCKELELNSPELTDRYIDRQIDAVNGF